MSWNDDSWRDGYDAWKLQSPYDDEGPEDCHDCSDSFRILTDGRTAECRVCGETWWANAEELDAKRNEIVEQQEWMRRRARREFWRRLTLPIRWPIFRLFERVWPRQACRVLDDSELPF